MLHSRPYRQDASPFRIQVIELERENRELRRTLSWLYAVAIVLAAVIGCGVNAICR